MKYANNLKINIKINNFWNLFESNQNNIKYLFYKFKTALITLSWVLCTDVRNVITFSVFKNLLNFWIFKISYFYFFILAYCLLLNIFPKCVLVLFHWAKQQYNILRIKGSATCFIRTESCAQRYCFSETLKLLKSTLPLKRK